MEYSRNAGMPKTHVNILSCARALREAGWQHNCYSQFHDNRRSPLILDPHVHTSTVSPDADSLAGLFVYGVSHRDSAVETRERCSVKAEEREAAGGRALLAGGHREQVVLSTCNRTEIYGVSDGLPPPPALLFTALTGETTSFPPHGFVLFGSDAARHLAAVTSGLESMVLGETEIVGQVKQAYEEARQAGRTGRVLNKVFQTALRASKAVRSHTGIADGAASIGAVCALHARDVLTGCPGDRRVLVIGAGDMAETCARHLHKNGFRHLVVANRSPANAERLAARFEGRAVGLDRLEEEMSKADVVICSTSSPSAVVTRPLAEAALAIRGERPLLLLDLAMPRDVDPSVDDLPGVHRLDLDHLGAVARRQQRRRREDLVAARRLVDLHVDELVQQLQVGARLGSAPAQTGRTVPGRGAEPTKPLPV